MELEDFAAKHQTLSIVALTGAIATVLLSVALVAFNRWDDEYLRIRQQSESEVTWDCADIG